MKQLLISTLLVSAAAMSPVQQASAHVSYYDLFNNPATSIVSGAGITQYGGGDVVAGNYGWADAADADWGDSHKGSWVKFDITDAAGALVNITVAGDGINQYYNNNPNDVLVRVGDLTPGFSLYSGLVPDEAHDDATFGFLPTDPQYGKEGAWQALADTTMGNDNGELNTIHYINHAGVVDGLSTSVSLNNIFLAQGTYSLVIGGTCYLRADCGAFNKFTADDTARGYTINIGVSAVPLPTATWLMLSGIFGMLAVRKRKNLIQP